MTGNYSLFLAAILGLSLYSAVVEGGDCGCIEKTLKQHACSSQFGKFLFLLFHHRRNIKKKLCFQHFIVGGIYM